MAASPTIIVKRDLTGLARTRRLYLFRALIGLGATAALASVAAEARRFTHMPVQYHLGWHQHQGEELFRAALAIQLLYVLLVVPFQALGRVSLDRARGTWDLVRLSQLGSLRALVGKLAGVLATTAATVLVVAPVQMIATAMGGVTQRDLWVRRHRAGRGRPPGRRPGTGGRVLPPQHPPRHRDDGGLRPGRLGPDAHRARGPGGATPRSLPLQAGRGLSPPEPWSSPSATRTRPRSR